MPNDATGSEDADDGAADDPAPDAAASDAMASDAASDAATDAASGDAANVFFRCVPKWCICSTCMGAGGHLLSRLWR